MTAPQPTITRLVVVDDHEIIRHGFREALADQEDVTVVGEASHGREALKLLESTAADVVVTDLHMPVMDGMELLERLSTQHPHITTIVLTILAEADKIQQCLDLGASGYLLKDATTDEIIRSLRRAMEGELVLSSTVGSLIARRLQDREDSTLSDRELEILQAVSTGATNARIASELFISETTVRTHLRRAYAKLGVQDRTSAVTVALSRGLIHPSTADSGR